ncbi:MAG: TadE/TadG family type IV pilus assembly protein [Bdellovibrio sp.]
MKRFKPTEKGQFVIEAVLLMVVMLGIFLASINALKEGQFLAKLISGPWVKISGMIESGVWEDEKVTKKTSHPNTFNRTVSFKPE